jgi:DNA-binding IclR family transcriptional regulator
MAHELKAKGRGATEIAEEMDINRASVYRMLEAGVIHGEG